MTNQEAEEKTPGQERLVQNPGRRLEITYFEKRERNANNASHHERQGRAPPKPHPNHARTRCQQNETPNPTPWETCTQMHDLGRKEEEENHRKNEEQQAPEG
jgi:hypothetical protein